MLRTCLTLALLSLVACGGSDSSVQKELGVNGPTYDEQDDGTIVRKFDIDGDGKVDVAKYVRTTPDPNDPSVTKTMMVKKEIDANSDGRPDLIKYYNELGAVLREEVDVDLDGTIDLINHLDGGIVAKKEILKEGSDIPDSVRFYTNGTITRVEKDTNSDSKVDLWEFYEQGVLDRIGRDLNGDGRADTWQTR